MKMPPVCHRGCRGLFLSSPITAEGNSTLTGYRPLILTDCRPLTFFLPSPLQQVKMDAGMEAGEGEGEVRGLPAPFRENQRMFRRSIAMRRAISVTCALVALV